MSPSRQQQLSQEGLAPSWQTENIIPPHQENRNRIKGNSESFWKKNSPKNISTELRRHQPGELSWNKLGRGADVPLVPAPHPEHVSASSRTAPGHQFWAEQPSLRPGSHQNLPLLDRVLPRAGDSKGIWAPGMWALSSGMYWRQGKVPSAAPAITKIPVPECPARPGSVGQAGGSRVWAGWVITALSTTIYCQPSLVPSPASSQLPRHTIICVCSPTTKHWQFMSRNQSLNTRQLILAVQTRYMTAEPWGRAGAWTDRSEQSISLQTALKALHWMGSAVAVEGEAGDSPSHLLLVTCVSPGPRGVLGGVAQLPSPMGTIIPDWRGCSWSLIPQEQLSHIPPLLFLTETTFGVNCSHQSQRPATNSEIPSQLTTR